MANSITTIDMVKDAAQIQPSNSRWDDVLTDWIAVAGDAYERRYQKLLNATDLTETYHDVSSGQLLGLRHAPINSIASIVTYDTEDALTSTALIATTDYKVVDPNTGLLQFTKLSAFIPVGLSEVMALVPINWGRIVVVYNTGFAVNQVPLMVQRGAAELLAHWFDQYGTNQEVKASKIGDISNDYYDYTKWPETVREMWAAYDTTADKYVGII